MERLEIFAFPMLLAKRKYQGITVTASEVFELQKEHFVFPELREQDQTASLRAVVFPRFSGVARPTMTRIAPAQTAFQLIESLSKFVDGNWIVRR